LPAYEVVLDRIRAESGEKPTGRSAKTEKSIVDKLRRQSIRLSQMQDIAGCRIVVEGVRRQNEVVTAIKGVFAEVEIVDRRENPSHGYRAVHLVVSTGGRAIEVQVRTNLQHLWAEYSEKLSDVYDPAIKYGGGPQEIVDELRELSELVGYAEFAEQTSEMYDTSIEASHPAEVPNLDATMKDFESATSYAKAQLRGRLQALIERIPRKEP
jgi:ppGpp synthetase/RelA/SpoT-type nucleotidyltranferase